MALSLPSVWVASLGLPNCEHGTLDVNDDTLASTGLLDVLSNPEVQWKQLNLKGQKPWTPLGLFARYNNHKKVLPKHEQPSDLPLSVLSQQAL